MQFSLIDTGAQFNLVVGGSFTSAVVNQNPTIDPIVVETAGVQFVGPTLAEVESLIDDKIELDNTEHDDVDVGNLAQLFVNA